MRRSGLTVLVAVFVLLDLVVLALGYRATHRPPPALDDASVATSPSATAGSPSWRRT